MNYQDYIDLGFERIELNDDIQFKHSGYSGFSLEKKVSDNIFVKVFSDDLQDPKMFIIGDTDKVIFHIIPISTDAVRDIFWKGEKDLNNFA